VDGELIFVRCTRIPGLIRDPDFGGVGTRVIGHVHMHWYEYVKRGEIP